MDRTDRSPALAAPHDASDRTPSRRGFLRSSTIAGVMATPIVAAFASRASAGFGGSTATGLTPNEQKVVARQFRSIQNHENVHVDRLRSKIKALSGKPRPKPTFQGLEQTSYAAFLSLAQGLEAAGVAAYGGAAPAIFDPATLAVAASIASVEARHAGLLNGLSQLLPTVSFVNTGADPSFDTPYTAAQVTSVASGFFKSLNGGLPLDYSAVDPSTKNDIKILNFALALEYLEAEFYNINVPKFFGNP